MARQRMVTRTINVTEVTAICMDITTTEVITKVLELTGDTYDKETALKPIKKAYETDTFKVVAINSISVREECYGMTELDFLKVAKKLDPQTRKSLETE